MNSEANFILGLPWLQQILAIFGVLVFRSLLFAGGSSLWINFSKWLRAKRIVAGEIDRKKLWVEILHGFKILLLDACVAVIFLKTGLLHIVPLESSLQFVVTFLIFFVWVEIYFYYSHRLIHHPRLFWIHRHHHQATIVNPWTSLSFSVVERLVLLFGVIGITAVVSFWFPFTIEAYAIYFAVNYILNVYGHLNVEIMPTAFVHNPIGKVINTTTYHTLHHIRYRGHYGLFTSVMDKIHNTYFKDYESVQEINYNKAPVILNSEALSN